MAKPAFDPNQPFESSKPAFDPNQSFEKVSEPSALDTLGEKLKDFGSQLKTSTNAALTGAAKGASLGYLPQIRGANSAVASYLDGSGEGSFSDRYLKYRDQELGREKELSEKAPISDIGGQLVGGTMLPAPGAAAASGVGHLTHGAVLGAGYGLAMNPGDKEGVIDPLQSSERGSNAMVGGAFGSGLSALTGAAPAIAKKGINTFLGPNEEGINKYLAGRDRINSAPNLEQLKNMIDQQVGDVNNNVLRSEVAHANAKTNLSQANANLSSAENKAANDYRDGLFSARGNSDVANDQLKTAKEQAQKVIQGSVEHPGVMADEVHASVAGLKKQVVDESAKARDILANSNSTIQIDPLVKQLKAAEAHLYPADAPAITDQAKASQAKLKGLIKDVSDLPDNVSGNGAKNLLRQLDDEAEWSRENGGFGSSHDQTLKALRRSIDTQLKENPEYAAQMKIVSDKTNLLDKANDLFGTREKAHSAMNTIAADSRVPQRDILSQLGGATGKKFGENVEAYRGTQTALKNMTPVYDGLPQTKAADKAAMLEDILSNPAYRDNRISQAVDSTGAPKQVSQAQDMLAALAHKLEGARAEAEPVRGWSPGSTQSKLQSLISRAPGKASIETGRELEYLNGLRTDEGPSYMQSIDDNRVRSQFSQDQTRGSRNVNLWKAIGGAMGGAAGFAVPGSHVMTVPAAGAGGAMIGGYIDKNGGAMAKSALDSYLNHKAGVDFTRANAMRTLPSFMTTRRKDGE